MPSSRWSGSDFLRLIDTLTAGLRTVPFSKRPGGIPGWFVTTLRGPDACEDTGQMALEASK